MRMSFVFWVFSLFIVPHAWAGEEYAVSKIPAGLLKDADAVLRTEEQRFEIINTKRAIYTHHYVITVL